MYEKGPTSSYAMCLNYYYVVLSSRCIGYPRPRQPFLAFKLFVIHSKSFDICMPTCETTFKMSHYVQSFVVPKKFRTGKNFSPGCQIRCSNTDRSLHSKAKHDKM